jgi:hypothetical protein
MLIPPSFFYPILGTSIVKIRKLVGTMDPRLWELLNTPPGTLYINNISLSQQGKSVIIDCETFNDAYPNGKCFRLRFSHCRDLHWQASDPMRPDDAAAEALGVYLGEQLHGKPAVVYTGGTEMSVLYNSIEIDG